METTQAKELTVKVREYFGRVTIVPVCPQALLFAELLGQKTLTQENIEVIKRLGYEVRNAEGKL